MKAIAKSKYEKKHTVRLNLGTRMVEEQLYQSVDDNSPYVQKRSVLHLQNQLPNIVYSTSAIKDFRHFGVTIHQNSIIIDMNYQKYLLFNSQRLEKNEAYDLSHPPYHLLYQYQRERAIYQSLKDDDDTMTIPIAPKVPEIYKSNIHLDFNWDFWFNMTYNIKENADELKMKVVNSLSNAPTPLTRCVKDVVKLRKFINEAVGVLVTGNVSKETKDCSMAIFNNNITLLNSIEVELLKLQTHLASNVSRIDKILSEGLAYYDKHNPSLEKLLKKLLSDEISLDNATAKIELDGNVGGMIKDIICAYQEFSYSMLPTLIIVTFTCLKKEANRCPHIVTLRAEDQELDLLNFKRIEWVLRDVVETELEVDDDN